MAVARKILPLLFVVALAGPFCRWLVASIGKPLWADELITVALVKTASFPHLLAAVLLGLDATPPLYTGYGWLILHHVFQETPPELLPRLTNAALVGATLWILYLLIRCYFGQVTALTTIGAFVLLEMWPLKFLTLEVRTYAALVFFATLSVYFGLRALARPTWVTLTGAMLAYCLLVSSHTFGIIYVVSIATCAVAAAAGNFRLALTSALSAAPAATMFGLWLPVLHHQAQLGSWIFRPDLASLLSSTHLSADRLWVLVVLVVLAVLTLLLRGYRLREGLSPAQWWRSSNRTLRFALCLPIAFYGSTFAVWLFSRFVFPVFVQRYFYPNMILNTIWLSIAIDLILGYVILATTRYWLALGSAVLAGLFIRQWQWPEYSIPCFDASRKAYIEDPFIDNGPIVALWIQPWLTRLNRPGERVVFPIDEGTLKENGINHGRYLHYDRYVRHYAEWAGVDALMTTSQLLASKPGFLVLDDANGPWLAYIQREHRVKLTPLAEMEGCTLWRVQALE